MIAAGDSKGYIMSYDVRNQHAVGGFKGVGGSVRSIVHHPTLPLMASCGLDRYHLFIWMMGVYVHIIDCNVDVVWCGRCVCIIVVDLYALLVK